jgi:hypothetical protein
MLDEDYHIPILNANRAKIKDKKESWECPEKSAHPAFS